MKTRKPSVPIIRTYISGSAFSACLLACLFMSISSVQAADVILDGNNNVTRIQNLELRDDQGQPQTYDVDFVFDTGYSVYGSGLEFTFNNEEDAINALAQVQDALNTNSPVPVGASSTGTDQYFIGAEEDDGFIAAVGGENKGGVWDKCTTNCVVGTAILNPNNQSTYAKFTVASGGSTNQPPVANAGGSYSGQTGVAISFNGTGSSDPDGSITSYSWNFGDNTTGFGASPNHTYNEAGTFTVNLQVTDNDGAVDTDSTTAVIEAESQPEPPSTSTDLILADGTASGSWYNPARNGEGFFFEIAESGDSNLASIAMFSFDAMGNPLWISGVAAIGPADTSAEIPVSQFDGPVWGSGFNTDDLNVTPFGTITVRFPSCNDALFQVNTEVSLESGSYGLIRLTTLEGLGCTDEPPQQSYTPGLWVGENVCFNVADDGKTITEVGSGCDLGFAFDSSLPGINNEGDACDVEADCEGAWTIQGGTFSCVSEFGTLAIGNFNSFTSASGLTFEGESGQGEYCSASWTASPQ
jgi:PKD repeat protein